MDQAVTDKPNEAPTVTFGDVSIHHLPLFWPKAAPLLQAAIERGSDQTLALVHDRLCWSQARLWVAVEDRDVVTAVVTELDERPAFRVCWIVLGGGKLHDGWRDHQKVLEAYARAQGCKFIRIWGRPAWQRLCPDYDRITILEKSL